MYVILKDLINNSYTGTFVFWDHQVRSCIRQLLEGLDYLHHLSIIHLDIKVDSHESTLVAAVSCKNYMKKEIFKNVHWYFFFHCFSDGRKNNKIYFSYSLPSLITSSWRTPTVIRSESVTSATQ